MTDNLADDLPCDGCGESTADPVLCDHDRALCLSCVEDSRCPQCRTQGRLANWSLM